MGDWIHVLMYERFTDDARTVMKLASENARHLKHEYVGTEHILLGLAEYGSGVALCVLTSLAIDPSEISSVVREIVVQAPFTVRGRQLPQTPNAPKVIEFAMEEARGLGHQYIGTEHILLGLLRDHEGVAAQVLVEFVESQTIRSSVLELIHSRDYDARKEPVGASPSGVGCSIGLVVLCAVAACILAI